MKTILNVFTNGFDGRPCTIAGKTPRHVQWVYRRENFDGITLFEDGDMYSGVVEKTKSRWKVGWLNEPRELHPENYERIGEVRERLDLILTSDKDLLDTGMQFERCIRGGVWPARNLWQISEKTGDVCAFVTTKDTTSWHKMRRAVAKHILVDALDARTSGWTMERGWELMARYRFAVVCAPRDYYFLSEAILNPIALGCIPVFSGAQGIDEYLNMDGVITWQTLEELEVILPALTEARYDAMLNGARNNFDRLGEFEIPEDWMILGPLAPFVKDGEL
jgi:hypothetical protein